MEYANLTIRVEKTVRDTLAKVAASEDRSINYYLNKMICRHIKSIQKTDQQKLNPN